MINTCQMLRTKEYTSSVTEMRLPHSPCLRHEPFPHTQYPLASGSFQKQPPPGLKVVPSLTAPDISHLNTLSFLPWA